MNEIEQQKRIEELAKPKWSKPSNVVVERVVLEVVGKDIKQVQRIRLVTSIGDITHKPRKVIEEKTTSGFFDLESTKVELFNIDEFIINNPMLVKLAEESKKNPQKVLLTYATIGRLGDNNEEIFYKYVQRNQFETIYYEEFHGKDRSNVVAQEERQKKFEEREL